MFAQLPQPTALLLETLQSAINRLLIYDPDSRMALAQLEGRVIAIEVTEPALRLYLLPGHTGVELSAEQPASVDVTISGRGSALLAMITRGENSNSSQGHVEIRGDVHLAQRVQYILKSINIDWEEFLSQYVGDMAAHRLGRMGREMRGYLGSAGRSLAMQFSEYLRYEQNLLPARHEVDRFIEEVDALRDDVERVQARLKRLEQKRGNHS